MNPSNLSFSSRKDVARKASECELRIRATARRSVRLERRHRELHQSDHASLLPVPTIFASLSPEIWQPRRLLRPIMQTSLPLSLGINNPLIRDFQIPPSSSPSLSCSFSLVEI